MKNDYNQEAQELHCIHSIFHAICLSIILILICCFIQMNREIKDYKNENGILKAENEILKFKINFVSKMIKVEENKE